MVEETVGQRKLSLGMAGNGDDKKDVEAAFDIM